MFRLTFTLAAALYAGFVIWGKPEPVVSEAGADAIATPVIASVVQAGGSFDTPTVLGSSRGAAPEVTRAAAGPAIAPLSPAVIAASAPEPDAFRPRLIGEPVVVSLVSPSEEPASALEAAEPSGPLLRVTGSRVNMRAGPGTENAVVDSLPQGTLAEPLGEPVAGWQEIRDVETGRIGFMAARFLEPS
jgi:hypothetical protein